MMPAEIATHFLSQAEACERLGSPFTARLCGLFPLLLDETTSTGARVLGWPGDPRADALALRLCGALHHLVLSGADEALARVYPPAAADDARLAAEVTASIARNDLRTNAFLDSAPQTNEVARSGMLLPGFLVIARETGLPLVVHEIGASAGLNLLFDRFGYSYGDMAWGDRASPTQIVPDVLGAPVPLGGDMTILSRDGCDLSPIDSSDQAARLRLQSYVWADQMPRLDRLKGALRLALEMRPRLETCDAAVFVQRKLLDRPADAAFVLFHSIMWQYMPAQTQSAITQAMEEAGMKADASAPVAWLRMEPDDTLDPHAMLTLTMWPGGTSRRLARCDYHGRWIEWL